MFSGTFDSSMIDSLLQNSMRAASGANASRATFRVKDVHDMAVAAVAGLRSARDAQVQAATKEALKEKCEHRVKFLGIVYHSHAAYPTYDIAKKYSPQAMIASTFGKRQEHTCNALIDMTKMLIDAGRGDENMELSLNDFMSMMPPKV